MEDPITAFVTRGKCPFLHGINLSSGTAMARKMAIDPMTPASQHKPRPLVEEAEEMVRTFQLFHGPSGVLPLPGVSAPAPSPSSGHAPYLPPTQGVSKQPSSGCPFHQQQAGLQLQQVQTAKAPSATGVCPHASQGRPFPGAPGTVVHLTNDITNSKDSALDGALQLPSSHPKKPAAPIGLPPLPLASLSLGAGAGGWPDFSGFFQPKPKPKPKPAQQQRKPDGPSKQPKGQRLGSTGASSSSASVHLSSSGSAAFGSTGPAGASGAQGGSCPMRKWLGPLAGVVFNKQGHLSCPEPIVKMRAMLAATKPVRELRPQALHVKLAAVGLTTALLNVPCGMWREHTEKFSFGWFVAVHATIPFIAMLRKAVIMPKYAILFTIAAAIAGQSMGAKLERKRLAAPAAAAPARGLAAAAAPACAVSPQKSSKACGPHSDRPSAHAEGFGAATALPMASLSLNLGHWQAGLASAGSQHGVPRRRMATRAGTDQAEPQDTSIVALWLNRPVEAC